MACYDLDRFRRFIFESRFLELFEVDEARVEALRRDDEELLEFALQWLRFSLFQEKTMKIRQRGRRSKAPGWGADGEAGYSGECRVTDSLAHSRYGGGKPILVIGGGIAGLTTALEAAEAGCQVILVERAPYLGGRVARMHQYFPKLCPPTCGLEINFRRLRENPLVTLLTLAEVEEIHGSPGDYEATLLISPRFVTQACTLCGACAEACPAETAGRIQLRPF